MTQIAVTVGEFLRCTNPVCYAHDHPVRSTAQVDVRCPAQQSTIGQTRVREPGSSIHDWEDYPAAQFTRS